MAKTKTLVETWHIQDDGTWVRRDELMTEAQLQSYADEMETRSELRRKSAVGVGDCERHLIPPQESNSGRATNAGRILSL